MIRRIIKEGLLSAGLTQSELSRRAGISRSLLSEFLSGKKDVSIGHLEKILCVLDIKMNFDDNKK